MPEQEYILGYHIREMFLDMDRAWDAARREQYLLRMDVRKPLSVDCAVWPFFFDPLESEKPQDWRIGCADLWEETDALRIFVQSDDGRPNKPHRIIGITLDVLSYADAEEWCRRQGKLLGHLASRAIKGKVPWPRLGYDVADGAMISALTNTGWLAETENVWALREKWWPLLNENHLFERSADARQFRDYSSVRFKENAPFFVFGIYDMSENPKP